MKTLQTLLEHRPVRLVENVAAELDDIVRPNAEEMRVKRGVVQAAQRETVRNNRKPLRMPVWQDVRSLKHVPESAYCAVPLVRFHNAFAK